MNSFNFVFGGGYGVSYRKGDKNFIEHEIGVLALENVGELPANRRLGGNIKNLEQATGFEQVELFNLQMAITSINRDRDFKQNIFIDSQLKVESNKVTIHYLYGGQYNELNLESVNKVL